MKKIFTLLSMLLVVAFTQAQTRYFQAVLQGSQQVPSNASTAGGVAIVKYNTATKYLELVANYNGLSADVTMSHIHSPAAAGANAGVLFDLANTGGTTGTLSGNPTLTPAQEADLFNGLMYVNVHNATYPGGEIRGQLYATTDGQTDYFDGRLQGAQQVPPNSSTGFGGVRVLVDKAKDSVYLTGNFSGLSTAAAASHIHNGALPSANGPVFLDLIFSNATSGTLHIAAPISDANITQMQNNSTYVNIHNATYPGGEIRAQLTMFSIKKYLKATLDGAQEVPSNASTGRGTVIVAYNTDTKALELFGDYQNLTSAATMAHIHSPAAPGTNAPVSVPLSTGGGTSGTLNGIAILTQVQENDLLNGLSYVNVHNATYPGGEIRGQLTTTVGAAEFLTGTLLGSQEVPANASTANGRVSVLLDNLASTVYATGFFTGLTTAASAAHIHKGIAGSNGPVIVPLSVTNGTAGTVTGSGVVSAGFADSLIKGFAYVNVHNATFPGGEIRAQLGDLVLPLKLLYFNGFKDGNNISLVWEINPDEKLRSFEVEQQDLASGRWIKKATVSPDASGSTAKYNTKDIPSLVNKGYVLYRLKITDATGNISYSPIIRINFGQAKASISIVSNPIVNGTLQFTVTGLASDKKTEMRVLDYSGRILLSKNGTSLQNNRLDVRNLAAGVYRLVVYVDDTVLQENFSKY
jgi:hypothetical protein